MKRQFKFDYLIAIFLAFIPLVPVAQNRQQEIIPDWQHHIYKILTEDKSREVLKDSIAIYTFNLKLNIIKQKAGKPKVSQLLVSDNLVYKLFPNYKRLYTIDYSKLLINRNNASLIVPILIYNVSPTGKSKYERQNEQPVVAIESAINIFESSLFGISSNRKNKFKAQITLEPFVIKIINTKDKEPNLFDNKIK